MARSNDPFDTWRQWLDRSERQINTLLGEITSSPTFGKAQAQMMETLLKTQQGMNSAAERYFSAINVPTRTDILELGGRLAQVEERLSNIEGVLLSLAGSRAPKAARGKRPARTKKPPTAEPAEQAAPQRAAKKATKEKTTKKAAAKKATPKKKVAKKKTAKKSAGRKKVTAKTAKTRAASTRKAKTTKKKATRTRAKK